MNRYVSEGKSLYTLTLTELSELDEWVERDIKMTKCGNCGEEIDGPVYSLDSDPDMPLCSHCHVTG